MRILFVKLIFIVLFLAVFATKASAAVVLAAPSAPTVSIKMIESKPSIGKVSGSENIYYVDLEWTAEFPEGAANKYINIYMIKEVKGGRPQTTRALRERGLQASNPGIRITGLQPGIVYHFDATSYYSKIDSELLYTSVESEHSNEVKTLTDISLKSENYSASQVKISWDDVWYKSERIDYKLYISESETFTNVSPIIIDHRTQIGIDRPIEVDDVNNRLEYTVSVREPGRIYYIKIAPDYTDSYLTASDYSDTDIVSSMIFVEPTKISQTTGGVVWKMDWNEVSTGQNDPEIKITYDIFKVNAVSVNLPQKIATIDDTSLIVIVPEAETGFYYQVFANVTKNGIKLFPLDIKSDRIFFNDEVSSAEPQVPELVDKFEDSKGEVIIDSQDELKAKSAVIIWRAPLLDSGEVDTSVKYDMWVFTDPNSMQTPPTGSKILNNYVFSISNYVQNSGMTIGFKYNLTNLVPNTTYYCKIVAKRTRIEYVNNQFKDIEYPSQPAFGIIITPFDGANDRPIMPASPPFRIKINSEGSRMIGVKTATLQLKNLWYEKRNETTGKWEYIRTEKRTDTDITEFVPTNTLLDDVNYRKVVYDNDIKLDVAYVKYQEGMELNQKDDESNYKIKGIDLIANDSDENPLFNVDEIKHNVSIQLSGLDENTTYVAWIRVYRASTISYSDPSQAIIFTTKSNDRPITEKPEVPNFNYSYVVDTYADFGWPIKLNYNYYIRYNTVDELSTGSTATKVTYQELLENPYYKFKGLTPNTLYFFWLQVESINSSNQNILSEWSDSYGIKTLIKQPPSAPLGFGIKNGEDSITATSITYEWTAAPMAKYILEMALNAEFNNSSLIPVDTGNSHKAANLKTNTRYYARLFLIDLNTNEKSNSTDTLSIKTSRGGNEFDASQDTELIDTSEIIEKNVDSKNKSITVGIKGNAAERFIHNMITDTTSDYTIDIANDTAKTSKASVVITDGILRAFEDARENLIIKTSGLTILLRPRTLFDLQNGMEVRKLKDFNIEMNLETVSSNKENSKDMKFRTGVFQIDVGAYDDQNSVAVGKLNEPLVMQYPYVKKDWYKDRVTQFVQYNEKKQKWSPIKTTVRYDETLGKGYIQTESNMLGQFAIVDIGMGTFDDIYLNEYEQTIDNVTSVFPIKSISGESFEPDADITALQAIQIIFDILNIDGGNDYITSAYRAKMIDSVYEKNQKLTQKDALTMSVKLYEAKSGSEFETNNDRLLFAIQNNFLPDNNSYSPSGSLSKGMFMYIVEHALINAGELNSSSES